jgi:hypothetical protein
MQKVESLWQLSKAVEARKSVVVPTWSPFSKRRPAAFVMNLQGTVIMQMLNAGMYIYEKPENKAPKPEFAEAVRRYGNSVAKREDGIL